MRLKVEKQVICLSLLKCSGFLVILEGFSTLKKTLGVFIPSGHTWRSAAVRNVLSCKICCEQQLIICVAVAPSPQLDGRTVRRTWLRQRRQFWTGLIREPPRPPVAAPGLHQDPGRNEAEKSKCKILRTNVRTVMVAAPPQQVRFVWFCLCRGLCNWNLALKKGSLFVNT